MNLRLQQLLPTPLRERMLARTSDVWMQEREWQQGEHLFIQAPSGTGKTTLVHMLYGMREDYEGSILWNGQPIKKQNTVQRAAARATDISVIFQDLRLFPELTAWENLNIKRLLTNTVTEEEMGNWMARLGVADKKNSLGKTLSYGEQQRMAIIRALLQPFKWLLMDEPFSHLDKENTAKAAALIAEVVARNNAGFLLADLDENTFFPYTQTLHL